jgi:hypothetical protein
MFALFCHVFGRFDKIICQRPGNFVVPCELNPKTRSLFYPLAQNPVQSTCENIVTEPLQ